MHPDSAPGSVLALLARDPSARASRPFSYRVLRRCVCVRNQLRVVACENIGDHSGL